MLNRKIIYWICLWLEFNNLMACLQLVYIVLVNEPVMKQEQEQNMI